MRIDGFVKMVEENGVLTVNPKIFIDNELEALQGRLFARVELTVPGSSEPEVFNRDLFNWGGKREKQTVIDYNDSVPLKTLPKKP